MSALLEYAVFGQMIAVSGVDGEYVARLEGEPGSVWGKGPTPLAALGDCVVRWSAGGRESEAADDVAVEPARTVGTSCHQYPRAAASACP